MVALGRATPGPSNLPTSLTTGAKPVLEEVVSGTGEAELPATHTGRAPVGQGEEADLNQHQICCSPRKIREEGNRICAGDGRNSRARHQRRRHRSQVEGWN